MATLEEQLGAMVKYHRGRVGLSQQELADRIGKTSVTVSRIENGKSATEFSGLTGLAEALGVEVRDLFGIGTFAAREGREDPLVGIVDKLVGLNAEELTRISAMIDSALSFRGAK